MSFIDAHKVRWGIEPICKVLQVAPSTYYAAVSRQPSARQRRDEELKVEIARVHHANFGVYGIEKVWRQLNREGVQVGRDRVHRLMDEMDLEGVVRGKRKPITTMSNEVDTRRLIEFLMDLHHLESGRKMVLLWDGCRAPQSLHDGLDRQPTFVANGRTPACLRA